MTTEELFYGIGIVAMTLWIILIIALTIGLILIRRKIRSFQESKYSKLLSILSPRKAELLGAATLALTGFIADVFNKKISQRRNKTS